MKQRVRPSPKLIAYPTIGVVFLLAGALLGRVEAAEVGMAFFAAALVGLAMSRRPRYIFRLALDQEAVMEGESASAEIRVAAESFVPWLSIEVATSSALEARVKRERGAIELDAGAVRKIPLSWKTRRWGVLDIGPAIATAQDGLGFFTFETRFDDRLALRVFPHEEVIARAIRPAETQLNSGDEISRRIGEGIEFANVRPFQHGDRVRRINWAVSTRLQKLHINEAHAERNADVVIFLDTFSEFGDQRDSTLLMAVRATAAVARHYLRRRDRVGLVGFGGTLRWQLPGMGLRQAYRIVEALLSTDAMLSYAWKSIDVIPARTLPPNALVIAISPLLDERTTTALLDLRGRGFDLVIVEVSPVPFIADPRNQEEDIARRFWLMKRESMRNQYWTAGVPVVQWVHGQPLVAALQEVEAFRRFGRRLRIS